MCDLLRACLSEGYEVIATVDPEQALGLALEHKPDAILLDLMMPKFSGFELCQSFRSLSYTSTIPILVITGEMGTKYKDHCLEAFDTLFNKRDYARHGGRRAPGTSEKSLHAVSEIA